MHRQRSAGSRGRSTVESDRVGEVAPPQDLAAAKARRIGQLWTSCDAYERQFFSGGVHAQMLELKLQGSQKALGNQRWILTLWRLYYQRKAEINALHTVGEVGTYPIDFTSFGRPPYSVEEMLADVQL